jgi:hypothetical protein
MMSGDGNKRKERDFMTARAREQVKTKRSYWSGIEAEQIIQRVAEGDTDLTEEAERLDVQAKVDRELFLLPEEQTALDALDAKLLAGKKSPIRKVK